MRFLALTLLVVACSPHPPHGGGGSGTGTADPGDDDATPVTAPADAAGPAALTDDECDAFVEHIVRVSYAEKKDAKITEDDIATAKARLSDEMKPGCLAMDRPTYDCVMAAADTAAIQLCAGGG